MDNIINNDDLMIGFVRDIKKYTKKCMFDALTNDDTMEIRNFADLLDDLNVFDDWDLVKIEQSLMGCYVVKKINIEED